MFVVIDKREKGHWKSSKERKKDLQHWVFQAVTHPSTNPAQCCLTSVIRREPVHSAWYGRRTLKHIDKAFYIAEMWQKGYRRWEITLRDDKG